MGYLEVVKKVGAKNEKGEYIIPLEYDEIKKLKTDVYVATRAINDEFLSKDSYHLFTEKGRLDYYKEGCITGILYDKNEEIFALETKNLSGCEWHLVEIDYEKNVINKLYKNSIREVQLFNTNDCILIRTLQNVGEIYSRKWKQVIYDLGETSRIFDSGKEGFVIERDGLKGFVNLEGVRVLDYEWNWINPQEEFIVVTKEVGNGDFSFGLYTYEGAEVLPCKYWGKEYIPGIIPERCRIDDATVWLFNTRRKEDGIYYYELIRDNGEVILSVSGDDVFMSDVSIRVYERDNVIVKQKNKATLYKLEMNNLREIKALVLIEADKIEKLPKYGQYSIYKGRRKGKCNKNGTIIEPFRFIVRKE